MDLTTARESVVQAGKKLVEKGLIARTWGNVSCRISSKQFAITPSGRAYETLTADDIVTVNIEDCSYTGEMEPSSEKRVHAEVYRQRDDVNFVIHTHQPYASAVSLLGSDIDISGSTVSSLLGDRVVSIPYALPGTNKLRNNVAAALSRHAVQAYLMVSHGAICLGKDCAEAFLVASELEQACFDYVNERYIEISGSKSADQSQLRDYFVELQTGTPAGSNDLKTHKIYNSERTAAGFILYPGVSEDKPFAAESEAVQVSFDLPIPGTVKPDIAAAAAVHNHIYKSQEEVGAIIHTLAPDILAVSQTGSGICPLLDDFAQIIGTRVRSVDFAAIHEPLIIAKKILAGIKGRSAVLIKNNGAVCIGPTKCDAEAAAMIIDKNCKALIATAIFSKGRPINPLECILMRYIYLKRYSKKL